MRSTKHKQEKNIRKLKEVEVLISQGLPPPAAAQMVGISIRTFYRWRMLYGRMRVDQAKRLINLEAENLRLTCLMARGEHEILRLKELLSSESKEFLAV